MTTGANKRTKRGTKRNRSVEKMEPSDGRTFEDDRDMTVSQPISAPPTSMVSKFVLVQNFVEKTLQKGVVGLMAEFRGMKRSNDFNLMKAFSSPESAPRNRYKDVGCLDNARVVLTIGPVPYIHANYVDAVSYPKRFICTQGPMPSTNADFWTMVIQEKAPAILMLCDFVEQKKPKCAEYYPIKESTTMTFGSGAGEVKVTHIKHETHAFKTETKTKVVRTKLGIQGYGISHTCYHFHWLEWPDRGVPPIDSAATELLNALRNKLDSRRPLVIHCSAGVGRTGSIVLLETALCAFLTQKPLEEMNTYLLEIRNQRNNSVQTELQYLWAHMTMLHYLKTQSCIPSQVMTHYEKFQKDYDQKTAGFSNA